jgi:hypothetical protein
MPTSCSPTGSPASRRGTSRSESCSGNRSTTTAEVVTTRSSPTTSSAPPGRRGTTPGIARGGGSARPRTGMPHTNSTFVEFWKPREIALGGVTYQSAAQFVLCNMGDDPKLCDNSACPGAPPPPPPPPEECGDDTCGATETCSTCAADCGTCTDDSSDVYEPECVDCASCPLEEVCYPAAPGFCGDGLCEPPDESCSSCPSDCGECYPICGNGLCEMGEVCSTCSIDCGACPGPGSGSGSPSCGNGSCEMGEVCSTCSIDCGACRDRARAPDRHRVATPCERWGRCAARARSIAASARARVQARAEEYRRFNNCIRKLLDSECGRALGRYRQLNRRLRCPRGHNREVRCNAGAVPPL